MTSIEQTLLDALAACRDRFAFYVGHHLDKGDLDKAAENEKFVALANNAIAAAGQAYEAVQALAPHSCEDRERWVLWSGAVRPPTGPFERVVVKYRVGSIDSDEARWFNWETDGDDFDIIAYRLVEEGQP